MMCRKSPGVASGGGLARRVAASLVKTARDDYSPQACLSRVFLQPRYAKYKPAHYCDLFYYSKSMSKTKIYSKPFTNNITEKTTSYIIMIY
jgi:hypothetical protein